MMHENANQTFFHALKAAYWRVCLYKCESWPMLHKKANQRVIHAWKAAYWRVCPCRGMPATYFFMHTACLLSYTEIFPPCVTGECLHTEGSPCMRWHYEGFVPAWGFVFYAWYDLQRVCPGMIRSCKGSARSEKAYQKFVNVLKAFRRIFYAC